MSPIRPGKYANSTDEFPLPLDSAPRNNTEALRVLDIPLTRLHDSPLEARGQKLVDVSCVFPLFHLDPQDPRNYYFAQTDDYIQNCLNYGSKAFIGWVKASTIRE